MGEYELSVVRCRSLFDLFGIAPTVYRIHDETKINDIQKVFLSSIETKQELTVYLSKKIATVLSERRTQYVTVFGSTCDTNTDLDPLLADHTQKEADTSIVLHAIDITRRNPFSELTIACSDTDVLLILLNYFGQLCSTTVFHTLEHDRPLKPLAENWATWFAKVYLAITQ